MDFPSPQPNKTPLPADLPVISPAGFPLGPIFMLLFLFFVIGAGAVFYFTRSRPTVAPAPPADPVKEATTTVDWRLPGDGTGMASTSRGRDWTTAGGAAELISFADFYKPDQESIPAKESLKLPIKVKSDVNNYFEVARKIDLEQAIGDLNTYGFGQVENQFSKNTNDFYTAYQDLLSRDLPIMITSDFLFYYYENSLKQIFKDVEESVFYDDLYRISRLLFESADARYKEKFKEVGQTNDRILEARRLEAAHLAVALELLEPKEEQVVSRSGGDLNKFSLQDRTDYEFALPYYLTDDVGREVSLIKEGKQTVKSPVLLYETNYKKYVIPDAYRRKPKLNNFYLASQWYNSVWPLKDRDESCQSCLLDREDWSINLMAMSYLADDIYNSEEAKNRWAKIYKVIAFFNGLRRDLTYLDVRNALVETFGEDYKLDNLFAGHNENRDENLDRLAARLAKIEFLPLEGALVRNEENRPLIGTKLLADPYWPNDYIFGRLVAPRVGDYLGNSRLAPPELKITSCKKDYSYEFYRCGGSGQDIVNLLSPSQLDNPIFTVNSNYQNYQQESELLRREFDKFDPYAWHASIYWTTLDMGRKYLRSRGPGYWAEAPWREHQANTVYGAWGLLHFPADQLVGSWQKAGGLSGAESNDLSYVEPDLVLINELIANIDMVRETLLKLKLINESEQINRDLLKLSDDLRSTRAIVVKELKGENLTYDELKFITDLASEFSLDKLAGRSTVLFIGDENKKLGLNIGGVRYVAAVYVRQGKYYLTIGPIFKVTEY